MNVYSIKNEKLGFFNRPIYCENDAEALSYIQNVLMSDADRALLGLRGDLALYCLGYFDSKRGAFVSINVFPEINESGDPVLSFGDPLKVCDLAEIFDTIPEDKIPRSERELRELIGKQQEQILKLQTALDTLSVDKKGRISHE